MAVSRFSHLSPACPRARTSRQQGVVLFVALMALVAMSLAAVALMRSVDTNTLIAGNLAFRQAATTSADFGVEAAMTALETMSDTNLDPMTDTTHPINRSAPANGYYSNADPALNLGLDTSWTNSGSKLVDTGAYHLGYEVRYIIQRMCQLPGTDASPKVLSETAYRNNLQTGANDGALCLLSDADTDTSSKRVLAAPEAGGRKPGNPPLYRVTVRVTGPRNTLSYVQAFVY